MAEMIVGVHTYTHGNLINKEEVSMRCALLMIDKR